jgi:type I restriction enzyme, S subunit
VNKQNGYQKNGKQEMSEWKECKLGDVAVYRTGKLNSNAAISGGNYPFFTCSPETLYIDNYVFDTEALILAGNNADGVFSLKYYNGKFNAYQRTYIITIADKTIADYKFLFYSLKTQLSNLETISHGTATRYLTLPILNEIPIALPPLPEQQAIAGVLSSLDDKIDLLHRQNKTLEGMAEALWRKMFVEEADPGWRTTTLAEVAKVNEKSIDRYYPFVEIEYLDTSSITKGNINEFQNIALSEAPSRAKRIVRKNDIIISMVRPIQKHYGILKKVKSNTIVSTGFVVITCTNIDPHFVYILITQKDMTEYLDIIAEASTSAYPSLVPSDIEKIEFEMPSPEKMQPFSEYAANTWKIIEENQTQIRTLSKLRDTLLPKLMSGEVRVKC